MMRVFISVKIKSISHIVKKLEWCGIIKKWSNNFIHDGNLKQNIINNMLVFYAVGPMGCRTKGQTPKLEGDSLEREGRNRMRWLWTIIFRLQGAISQKQSLAVLCVGCWLVQKSDLDKGRNGRLFGTMNTSMYFLTTQLHHECHKRTILKTSVHQKTTTGGTEKVNLTTN